MEHIDKVNWARLLRDEMVDKNAMPSFGGNKTQIYKFEQTTIANTYGGFQDLTDFSLYRSNSEIFTKVGDSIKCNESGLYLISFNCGPINYAEAATNIGVAVRYPDDLKSPSVGFNTKVGELSAMGPAIVNVGTTLRLSMKWGGTANYTMISGELFLLKLGDIPPIYTPLPV